MTGPEEPKKGCEMEQFVVATLEAKSLTRKASIGKKINEANGD